MDWVKIVETAIIALAAAILGVAGSILINWLGNCKGYKEISAKLGDGQGVPLSTQHTQMENSLSLQHTQLQEAFIRAENSTQNSIENKIGQLSNTTLSGQHSSILEKINDIKSSMDQGRERELNTVSLLTSDQQNINRSIESLSAFSKVMVDLQTRNHDLLVSNKQLQKENLTLTENNKMLQQRTLELQIKLSRYEPRYNQNMEQEMTLY